MSSPAAQMRPAKLLERIEMPYVRSSSPGVTILIAVCSLFPCAAQDDAPPPPGISIELLDGMRVLPGKLSALPSFPPVPPDNPQTEAKIELGKRLFFDPRLSGDGSLSCASCHDPGKAYSDGRSRAVGIGKRILSRRS